MNNINTDVMEKLPDGRWVPAIPVPYPPTFFERIKHWFGFCKNCWICADDKTQAFYKENRERYIAMMAELQENSK